MPAAVPHGQTTMTKTGHSTAILRLGGTNLAAIIATLAAVINTADTNRLSSQSRSRQQRA